MRLINLTGPTSSGKSEIGVTLAQKLPNSVIISTDSRQIYKHLNIGTGKIAGFWNGETYEYKNIKHYLIDYVDESKQYTLAEYLSDFCSLFKYQNGNWIFGPNSKVESILLVGGTGLYSKAIVDKFQPGILKKPFQLDYATQKLNLTKTSLKDLQKQANKMNLHLNHSDYHNPRRLVSRILHQIGIQNNWFDELNYPNFAEIWNFVLDIDFEILKVNIAKRFETRFCDGLLTEINNLQNVSNQRLLDLGLEYRLAVLYQKGFLTLAEMKQKMLKENIAYARRQITWFKKQNYLKVTSMQDMLDHFFKTEMQAKIKNFGQV